MPLTSIASLTFDHLIVFVLPSYACPIKIRHAPIYKINFLSIHGFGLIQLAMGYQSK